MTPDFVFLSPHRDDICFSLGCLAATVGGTILNIFARSQYTIATEADFLPETIEKVTFLRRAEDREFMAIARLNEIDLGFAEAPVRGFDPFASQDADAEIPLIQAKLMDSLNHLIPSGAREKSWLFCPSAIGGHRDHVIVRNTVINCLEDLEQKYTIAFYEDLPYASAAERRNEGLSNIMEQLGENHFSRVALHLDLRPDLKLQLVNLYPSQHEARPVDLRLFTPAAGALTPHEAIWTREKITTDHRMRRMMRVTLGPSLPQM